MSEYEPLNGEPALPKTQDEGGQWADVNVDDLSYPEFVDFAHDTYADCSD